MKRVAVFIILLCAVLATLPGLGQSASGCMMRLELVNLPPYTTVHGLDRQPWESGPSMMLKLVRNVPCGSAVRVCNTCYTTSDGEECIDLEPRFRQARESELRNPSITVDLSELLQPRMTLSLEIGDPSLKAESIQFPSSGRSPAEQFTGDAGGIVCYPGFALDAETGFLDVTIHGSGNVFTDGILRYSQISVLPGEVLHLPPRGIKMYVAHKDLLPQAEQVAAYLTADLAHEAVPLSGPVVKSDRKLAQQDLAATGHDLGLFGERGLGGSDIRWYFLSSGLPSDIDLGSVETTFDIQPVGADKLGDRIQRDLSPIALPYLPFTALDREGSPYPVVVAVAPGAPSGLIVGAAITQAGRADSNRKIRSVVDLDELLTPHRERISLLVQPLIGKARWVKFDLRPGPTLLGPKKGWNPPDLPVTMFRLRQQAKDFSLDPVERYAAKLNMLAILASFADVEAPHGISELIAWFRNPNEGDCESQILGCGTVLYYRDLIKWSTRSGTPRGGADERLDRPDGVSLTSRVLIRGGKGK